MTASTIDKKLLARAARAAYERFVVEAGFEKDARVKDWKYLDIVHQRRWASIARAVIDASRGEVAGVREGGVQQPHDGADAIRPGVAKAPSQKSANRGSRAQRGRRS